MQLWGDKRFGVITVLLSWCFCAAVSITSMLLFARLSCAEQQPPQDENGFISYLGEKWTGDLDGIQKRRMLRVLLVYSKTIFLYRQGHAPRHALRRHDGP